MYTYDIIYDLCLDLWIKLPLVIFLKLKFVFPPPSLEDDSSTLEPSFNPDSELELEYDDVFSAQSMTYIILYQI